MRSQAYTARCGIPIRRSTKRRRKILSGTDKKDDRGSYKGIRLIGTKGENYTNLG